MALALSPERERHVLREEPMSRHTTWRVGGPAEVFFEPADAEELSSFLRELPGDVPIMWLGLGSNLLVRDGGLRGVVIHTHGGLDHLRRVSATDVAAGAGLHCARLAKQCVKWQLGPAEFFVGIPGTLGGALAMNAGAWGGETWRHVVDVETVDRRGERRVRPAADFHVGYRHVEMPAEEWFIGARLRFEARPQASNDDIRDLLQRRLATQPIGALSCGSVFTNPPGDHAARLIESAGLKGRRVGGASVSMKHANFIVNDRTASAADIERLIEEVRATVERVHGVRLVPEVRIVGDRPEGAQS